MDELELSLWHAVATSLESLEPRLVLADYLMEHGRPERGEVIVLQCQRAGDPAAISRIHTLCMRHWDDWLGKPLGALLDPGRSMLRGGMLDEVVVGRMSTFDRAVVARSHELWTVRVVRAGEIDAAGFASFARHPDLVNLSCVDASVLAGPGFECIRAFGRVGARWERITSLALRSLAFAAAGEGRNVRATIDELARVFPNLVALDLSHLSNHDDLLPLAIAALPDALPHLARVRLQAFNLLPEARRALEGMRHVERVS